MVDPFESGLPGPPGVYDNFQRMSYQRRKLMGSTQLKSESTISESHCSMLSSINLYYIVYNKSHMQYL